MNEKGLLYLLSKLYYIYYIIKNQQGLLKQTDLP